MLFQPSVTLTQVRLAGTAVASNHEYAPLLVHVPFLATSPCSPPVARPRPLSRPSSSRSLNPVVSISAPPPHESLLLLLCLHASHLLLLLCLHASHLVQSHAGREQDHLHAPTCQRLLPCFGSFGESVHGRAQSPAVAQLLIVTLTLGHGRAQSHHLNSLFTPKPRLGGAGARACVRVCVRVCVCARARPRVRACVCDP